MKSILIRLFMAANTLLIRLSGGRIGGRLGTQTVLLLHSLGRKSGKAYVTPIAYFRDGERYFIVASNWGRDPEAAWLLNLRKAPRTTIEVEGRTIPVEASEAQGEEYTRLWKYATEHHPQYIEYQKMTARHIPIVVLRVVG